MSQPSSGQRASDPVRPATAQELLWQGEFGREYTERNAVSPEARQPFFARVLGKTFGVSSICELGANRGHNLAAIRGLSDNYHLTGVELNPQAAALLGAQEGIRAVRSAILDFDSDEPFDLVYTCGVLIHLNPDDLPAVYRKMFALSARYILINEYFNPVPVSLDYRGHTDRLFKRDFGAEFLAANAHRACVADYGFLWQAVEPAWDNTTWWLFEKMKP
jgi:pseudaminic acid biosynthesis-associated methylase